MKHSGIILIILLSLSRITYGQPPDSLKFNSLSPAEFQSQIQNSKNALLIDVREFFEYKKSRIKNAINIPSSGKLDHITDTLDKQLDLFFYCTSGFRSKRVAKFFYDKGFTRLYSLDGGIMAWRKEKLPVEKKRLRAMSRVP